jgi:hypothetical protein
MLRIPEATLPQKPQKAKRCTGDHDGLVVRLKHAGFPESCRDRLYLLVASRFEPTQERRGARLLIAVFEETPTCLEKVGIYDIAFIGRRTKVYTIGAKEPCLAKPNPLRRVGGGERLGLKLGLLSRQARPTGVSAKQSLVN